MKKLVALMIAIAFFAGFSLIGCGPSASLRNRSTEGRGKTERLRLPQRRNRHPHRRSPRKRNRQQRSQHRRKSNVVCEGISGVKGIPSNF
jgi:hypothetical protein